MLVLLLVQLVILDILVSQVQPDLDSSVQLVQLAGLVQLVPLAQFRVQRVLHQ